jgi:hypothetical protein
MSVPFFFLSLCLSHFILFLSSSHTHTHFLSPSLLSLSIYNVHLPIFLFPISFLSSFSFFPFCFPSLLLPDSLYILSFVLPPFLLPYLYFFFFSPLYLSPYFSFFLSLPLLLSPTISLLSFPNLSLFPPPSLFPSIPKFLFHIFSSLFFFIPLFLPLSITSFMSFYFPLSLFAPHSSL